jgi:hypothetical protein
VGVTIIVCGCGYDCLWVWLCLYVDVGIVCMWV